MLFQLKQLKGVNSLVRNGLTLGEIQFLEEIQYDEYKIVNIRLREGEYQYGLAKAIASFQHELNFPNVREIIERLFGEEKNNDIRFIRKIQTILKKMERSKVVRILPKNKPWELQRYALLSFKFQDAEKNLVTLATDKQIEQMRNLLQRTSSKIEAPRAKLPYIKAKIFILTFAVVVSYAAILWDFMQPTINPIISISAFSISVVSSLMLGKMLARK